MGIEFEVVGRRGCLYREPGLDKVVVRRREAWSPGSELAILPGHAPLLALTEPCTVRMAKHGLVRLIEVGSGVLEVVDDRVTLVVT